MRAKKIFEWSNPPGVIITVDHLMKWYGGKDWEKETYITDSMGVDGEHAQDTDETGQIWIDFLAERKHAAIEVDAIDEGNAIGVSFELDGHSFNFQADAFPFEDDLGNPIALGGYELDESYRPQIVRFTSKRNRQEFTVTKNPDGRIIEITGLSGVRFPFSVGSMYNRNIETWACDNGFLIDGQDPCPEKKIFGIRTSQIPQGHPLRTAYPGKFR